jgi:cyclophilin family peptidyl-prolyl cis-trans isomerase
LVQLKTSDGTMLVELLDQAAPLSVDNFLSYVDSKKYDGTIWHRSVTDFVVQGGGYTTTTDADGKVTGFTHIATNPPVVNEFSPLRSNIRSTVAMAKVGGNPDSATSEFFFNVANNSANLDNQNGGFTVFANMVGTGMDRVDTINAGPNYTVTAPTGDMQNVPLQDITKPSPVASTDTKNPNYYTVNTASVVSLGEQLRFTVVSNSNPDVVTPTIVGNGLTLAYSATQTGTSIIVLRATDRAGHSTDTAFTVTVTAPVPV